MTDLETFRDHCRRMTDSEHTDDCGTEREDRWGWRTWWVKPNPDCGGCVTDDAKQLWARLADEIDAHLTEPDAAGLFDDLKEDPMTEQADHAPAAAIRERLREAGK